MVFRKGSNGFKSKLAVFVNILIILIISLIISIRGDKINSIPVDKIQATELFDYFVEDPGYAQNRFLNEIIIVEGEVQSVGEKSICLGSGMRRVRLEFRNRSFRELPPVSNGEILMIKGICRGLDYTEVFVGHSALLAQDD